MREILKILARDYRGKPIEIRTFKPPATIRALILCDRKRKPLVGFAGWYRYEEVTGEDGEFRVIGQANPSMLVEAKNFEGDRTILGFLMELFERNWRANERDIVIPSNGRQPRAGIKHSVAASAQLKSGVPTGSRRHHPRH
jgi:hypothetical protein